MAYFDEHALEMAIMDFLQDEGYKYVRGDSIHRQKNEVLLIDDLKNYLLNRYADEGLTLSEVNSIIFMLKSVSGTLYEANKSVFKMLCDGFVFNREDRSKKDLYIEFIDFDNPENNIFRVVNQFEVDGSITRPEFPTILYL